MAKLIAYGQVDGTTLKKAMCETCEQIYDNIGDAVACEIGHGLRQLDTGVKMVPLYTMDQLASMAREGRIGGGRI